MIKVRIEYDGNVREFKEDAVIALFPGKESTRLVIAGETSNNRVMNALTNCIPEILEREFDDRMDYVRAMIDVYECIGKKIKEELRAGGIHPLVDALVKTMGEELEK